MNGPSKDDVAVLIAIPVVGALGFLWWLFHSAFGWENLFRLLLN